MRGGARRPGAKRLRHRVARLTTLLLAVLVGLATATGVVAASGASKHASAVRSTGAQAPVSVVGADLITHVFPEIGHRVVAVALELNREVRLRPEAADARSAFTVQATLGGATAARTVTDVYSNERPVLHTGRSGAVRGKYLILELRAEDSNAAVNYVASDGATAPHQLVGAYSLTQTADVEDDQGVILAARPLAVTNDGVINPVVDEFARLRFTDSAGTSLSFRFFEPRRARFSRGERRFPLVLHLHGGGETGSPLVGPDNVVQITANRGAIVWATSERQARHPAYVVAPQLPERSSQWTAPAIKDAVISLVDQIAATYPIDTNRIYLSGLSRGGRGGVELLSEYPNKFAGALLASARAEGDDVSRVPQMADVPLWLTHATDDPTVPYSSTLAIMNALEAIGVRVTRGEWAGNNSQGPGQDQAAETAARALLKQANTTGSHTLFTTYTAGTVPVSAHFSWGPMYETEAMLEWLFSQSLLRRDSMRCIARRPRARSASTISRKLRSNPDRRAEGYRATTAHALAWERASEHDKPTPPRASRSATPRQAPVTEPRLW